VAHLFIQKTATTLRWKLVDGNRRKDLQRVRLVYQQPASSTFLSKQNSHQQPASNTFLSE
jgi:hypothetical protein